MRCCTSGGIVFGRDMGWAVRSCADKQTKALNAVSLNMMLIRTSPPAYCPHPIRGQLTIRRKSYGKASIESKPLTGLSWRAWSHADGITVISNSRFPRVVAYHCPAFKNAEGLAR